MSAKFVDADNKAAIVWVWHRETKMLYVETMANLTLAWPTSSSPMVMLPARLDANSNVVIPRP